MILNIYTVWITMMLSSYQDAILAGLVKRGYVVGPASGDGTTGMGRDNQPSYLFAVTVYKPSGQLTAEVLYNDIQNVLVGTKALYYSIVVAHAYDSIWAGCNFDSPAKNKATPPPLPPAKSNLN